MIVRHTKEVEQLMKEFYEGLSEKKKRHYVAIEAKKLGRSGITYISKLLACSRTTIHSRFAQFYTLFIRLWQTTLICHEYST